MKRRPLNLSRKWLIFTVTATGTFMGTLDGGIVNIALPSMAGEFNADIESIQSVVSVYLLAVTCFLPVFGKLSDMFSRKKMYLSGFLLFGIGSLLCSLAGNLPLMILSRAVQGLGASAMMANAQAIIAKAFVGKDRGRALGGVGAVVALGSLAGPAVGGFLIQHWGWQSVFWVNIPISLIGIWRGIQLIPRFNPKTKIRMDISGAVFFILSSLSFLYAMNEGPNKAWTSPVILGAFAAAVVFFLLFYYRERTSQTPFIGLDIFKIPAISYGYVVAVLGFMSIFTNAVLFPFYAADILHIDPVQTGLLVLPFPVALAISSTISGVLSERYSARIITTVGLGFAFTGAMLFAFVGDKPSFAYIVLAQVIFGCGSGTFQIPNNNTVISAAPKNKLGIVSSVNALARNAGMIMGIACSVAIYAAVQGHFEHAGSDSETAFLRGYQAAMFLGAALAAVGGVISAKRD
ncbi:MFS transporter [Candidatus Avelusimicrobium sp.]|uniref:MFS transporter n=1 Tax=Candidatus Avelusimicrobium sp. TaxID=3048833 RepID=UPI003D7E7081